MASGSDDGTVKLWDVKSGALKQTLQAQSRVWSVAFDAQGLLASGSRDGTVKLWDVKSGALKQTLQAQSPINSVAFDAQGLLASGSYDGTVKLWDVTQEQAGKDSRKYKLSSTLWGRGGALGESGCQWQCLGRRSWGFFTQG
ncbi:WD domain%2C G-beta repeat [Candidatus Venteria ishoeyi]|uniref:WD domain, G-beta repeat n=1 Tax=Candidatus Venteria ishoeyi TaxID=1899563 RepID=A0A1H6F7D6_9GAMM|nr:WD domain%2C G-beta repeat [Candidatus Venteria ishoeyi]